MGVLDTARSKGIHRPHLRNNEKINKAAGVVGKSRSNGEWNADKARQHHSAPLTTLQDPAGFGAPPRHRGAQAVAAQQSPTTTGPPALPSSSKPAIPSKPLPAGYASRGLGAALPKTAIDTYTGEAQKEEEEEKKNAAPPVPYRLNTTGLSTEGFAKPPVRRAETMETEQLALPSTRPSAPNSRPTPLPPPRVPARQNSRPDAYTPDPPPPYTNPSQADEPQHQQPAAPTSQGQLSELQSRFAKLPGRVSSPPAAPEPAPASQGSTWQQKQAAAQTARQFHQDPSSVSAADAYSAARTAQDFQQRHGEQVASGAQKAKALDAKYGVRGKVGGYLQSQSQSQAEQPAPVHPSSGLEQPAAAAAATKKPAPPPPPPKRRELQQGTGGGEAPPPIPLSSKPT